MTYCVGILLKDGIVLASDSRTNAGVDNFAKFCKMTVFERAGDRVLVLLSSGNLAGTQAVISVLKQRERRRRTDRPICGPPAPCSTSPVLVSDAVRDIERRDAPFLEGGPIAFNASFIVGGQLKGEPPRLFRDLRRGQLHRGRRRHAVSADRRSQVRKADHRSGPRAHHHARGRHQVRPRFLRFDHAQQLVGGHADRSGLLRAGQPGDPHAAPLRPRATPISRP